MKCQKCNKQITEGIANYSWKVFGEELCLDCQKKEREKRYPEKLARFLNSLPLEGRGGENTLVRHDPVPPEEEGKEEK